MVATLRVVCPKNTRYPRNLDWKPLQSKNLLNNRIWGMLVLNWSNNNDEDYTIVRLLRHALVLYETTIIISAFNVLLARPSELHLRPSPLERARLRLRSSRRSPRRLRRRRAGLGFQPDQNFSHNNLVKQIRWGYFIHQRSLVYVPNKLIYLRI